MAVCLFPDCGFGGARSLYHRTARVVEGEERQVIARQGWRIVYCPLCKRRSRQLVIHEGETSSGWLPDPGDCERFSSS